MEKRINPRLTAGQIQYKRLRLEGKSKREAYTGAGYSGNPQYMKQRIYDLENNEALNRYVEQHLEAEGVTMARVSRTVAEGLNAKVTETFLNKETGEVVYSEPMEDHQTRHKFASLATDLLGVNAAGRRARSAAPPAPTITTNILLVEQARQLTDAQLEELMQRRQAGLPVDHLLSLEPRSETR